MKKKQIVIIGAGASGLLAAILAARNGAAVTILEQNEKPGKKICATGNGKCNYTNLVMPEDAYRGTHPEFVKDALSQFSVEDTVEFFKEIGIYPQNRNGYLYPRSGQAQSIVEVLCMEAASLGVKIKTNEQVIAIEKNLPEKSNNSNKNDKNNKRFNVLTKGWHYEADAVILANGSKASSVAGSDGSGYLLAGKLGHKIVPVYPALTALKCKGNAFKTWAGVRTEGRVSLFLDGNFYKSERGELQLTEYGISGIPVFQLSTYAVRAVKDGHQVELRVDFLPELSEEETKGLLHFRKKNCPYKNEKELLTGLFPEKLIKVLTAQRHLLTAIREFPLEVTDGLAFSQAQVCSGGVDTNQVNAHTMESLLCPGIYLTGELLDIDGTCGGYNLQWAWSSGAVAGIHAALGTRSQ